MKLKRKYINEYDEGINVTLVNTGNKTYQVCVFDRMLKDKKFKSWGTPVSGMRCVIIESSDSKSAMSRNAADINTLLQRGHSPYTLMYIDSIEQSAEYNSLYASAIGTRNAIRSLIKYFKSKYENIVAVVNVNNNLKLYTEAFNKPFIKNINDIHESRLDCGDFYIYVTDAIYPILFTLYKDRLTIANNEYNTLVEDYNTLLSEKENLDDQLEDAYRVSEENNKTAFIDGVINSYRDDVINAEIASKLIGISKSSFYKKYKKNVNKSNVIYPDYEESNTNDENNETTIIAGDGDYA